MALSKNYKVTVTTLTGQAAENLRKQFSNNNAKTLQSWSDYGSNVEDGDMQKRMDYYGEIEETNILLIDDFSMLGRPLFKEIDTKCREKSIA